jgi:hypothetical protein
MNDSNPTLRKALKLLKKIAKKLGKKNLRCVAQISSDSDHDDGFITYSAMISSPDEGVSPITFAAFNRRDFIEKIEDFYKNKCNLDDLDIAYLEGKKIAAENTIKFADEQIERIKNPATEETTTEDEDTSEEEASKAE